MAFIPNENGTEVTVLLLNTDHYHMSDGSMMQPHKPVLYIRGNCSGDCDVDDGLDTFTFRDLSPETALDSLNYAIGDGTAWVITGSDLAVQKSSGAANLPSLSIRNNVRGTVNNEPRVIPETSTQRGDFSWIPALRELCEESCAIRSDLLDTIPPEIVAARFTIDSGDLYTYSVARLGSDVQPVQFQRLDGDGSASSYVQAVTSWVGLDITVTGTSVDLVETKHDESPGRTITLSPDNGVVEMAVMNLPPSVPPASSTNNAPQVGKHFEMYYDLLASPPDRETRLVPRLAEGVAVEEVSWSSIHPATSELLTRLRFEPGRSLYDRTICPPVKPDPFP
jgi:hypothetical protein